MPQYSTSFASPSSELFCLRLLSIVRAAVRVVRSVCCSGCPGCILGLVDHSAGGTVSMPRSTRMLADVQSRNCIVLLVAQHSRDVSWPRVDAKVNLKRSCILFVDLCSAGWGLRDAGELQAASEFKSRGS